MHTPEYYARQKREYEAIEVKIMNEYNNQKALDDKNALDFLLEGLYQHLNSKAGGLGDDKHDDAVCVEPSDNEHGLDGLFDVYPYDASGYDPEGCKLYNRRYLVLLDSQIENLAEPPASHRYEQKLTWSDTIIYIFRIDC